MFIDAVEDGDDGVAYRQIPLLLTSPSTLWISETGIIRRRYYNAFTRTWSWGESLPHHVDDTGAMFVYMGNGKLHINASIEGSWRQVEFEDDNDDVLLENAPSEHWVVCGMPSSTVTPQLQISSHGNFRNARGEQCGGVAFRKRIVVCLPGYATLDVQQLVDMHFHGAPSPSVKMPKRIEALLYALRANEDIETYATRANLKVSTVWSYMYDVFSCLDVEECVILSERYTSAAARRGMFMVFSRGLEHIFSGPAKVYVNYIDNLLAHESSWIDNAHRFAELRILKLLCERIDQQH